MTKPNHKYTPFQESFRVASTQISAGWKWFITIFSWPLIDECVHPVGRSTTGIKQLGFFFITIERHTFLFYLAHRGVGGLFVVGAVVVIARRLRLDGWPNIYISYHRFYEWEIRVHVQASNKACIAIIVGCERKQTTTLIRTYFSSCIAPNSLRLHKWPMVKLHCCY